MRTIEGPHLISIAAGGSLENESVFTLTKTKEGLSWHKEAKTDSSIDTATERGSLILVNCAINVTTNLLRDLFLQSRDVSDAVQLSVYLHLRLRRRS